MLKIIDEYESSIKVLADIGASSIMFKDSFLDPDYASMPLKIVRIAQAYARSDNTLKVKDEHVKKAYNTIINSTRIIMNELIEEPRKILPIRDTERRIYSIIKETDGISIDELSKRTGLRRNELLEIIELARAKFPIYHARGDLWRAI
jgi:DNA replicative helicase MCM subunit Mcm2 (Cdc46/Mcm family)